MTLFLTIILSLMTFLKLQILQSSLTITFDNEIHNVGTCLMWKVGLVCILCKQMSNERKIITQLCWFSLCGTSNSLFNFWSLPLAISDEAQKGKAT